MFLKQRLMANGWLLKQKQQLDNYRDSAGYGIVPSHAKYIRHVFSRNSIFIAPWHLPNIY